MCDLNQCCDDYNKPNIFKRKRILLRRGQAVENNNDISIAESPRSRPEEEFVNILTKLITETLEIGWRDRQTFISILKAAIGDTIRDLLDDYLDYWVEEYNNKIVREFKLDKNIKPEYSYANHAKLTPAIDAAVKKFEEVLTKQCKCKERKNAKKK